MKNRCSWLPEAIAIAGVAIGVGIGVHGVPDIDSQNLPAWVQALGSVGAIIGAVWVSYHQHAKAVERQQETQDQDVRAFLLGVREELESSWRVYQIQAGEALKKTPKGKMVQLYWLPPERPFKVYEATVGQIGRVPSDGLRALIIQTYVVVGGLLLTWVTHNRLLDEYGEQAKVAFSGNSFDADEIQEKFHELIDYGETLRTHQAVAGDHIAAVLLAIESFLQTGSPVLPSGSLNEIPEKA